MLHYSDGAPGEGAEFIGDGIARTGGNIPYNPESDDNASFPDDEFWNSRESLQQIKDYAVSRFVSPYAVLAVTLCRIIDATPPLWCCTHHWRGLRIVEFRRGDSW